MNWLMVLVVIGALGNLFHSGLADNFRLAVAAA